MSFDAALRPGRGGTLIDVEVSPNAAEDRFPAGYNEWRHAVEARVAAPPEEGRANAALLALVAAFFGVAPARVRLVAGERSRRKRLLVEAMTVEAAAARLAAAEARPNRFERGTSSPTGGSRRAPGAPRTGNRGAHR